MVEIEGVTEVLLLSLISNVHKYFVLHILFSALVKWWELMAPRTIQVFCHTCNFLLLTYRKGGKGQLIKIHLHKILTDYTKVKGICPGCGVQFGREAVIKNRPALRVIGGKVFWKG